MCIYPEQKKNINPVCEKSWTTIWVLIKITEKAVDCISEGVDGCVRDAIKILQQAAIASNNNIKEKHLKGLVDVESPYISHLLFLIANNDTAEIISYINNNVDSVTNKDFEEAVVATFSDIMKQSRLYQEKQLHD